MRLLIIAPLLAILLVLTGCASKIKPTGALQGGYTNFNVLDKVDHQVRLTPEALKVKAATPEQIAAGDKAGVKMRPVTFVIAEPIWDSPIGFPEDLRKQERIQFTLRERFYRYLLRNYSHPVRVRYAYRRTDERLKETRVITLRTRITDIKRGASVPRYIVGAGLGQTRIQVEGEFWEGVDNPVKIGEFAIRRAHGGYAQNGWNYRVMQDDYALRYAVEELATDFTKDMPGYLPGVTVE